MRTKLMLGAVALAAGLATSMAQTYSQNVVGYVNQTYPLGYALAANPLKTANNTIGEVLANAPQGVTVTKMTAGVFGAGNSLLPFGWGDPAMTLAPGEGFFIYSPSAWTNTYVGEVVMNSTNSMILGYNLVGSAWPAAGGINTDLQLVSTLEDNVWTFTAGNPGSYSAANTLLVFGWGSGEPNLAVAQGIMYQSKAVNNWVQNFTIP